MKNLLFIIVTMLLIFSFSFAQDAVQSNTQLIQPMNYDMNFGVSRDAIVSTMPYVQPVFVFNSYDGLNTIKFGAIGGYQFLPNLEVSAGWAFQNISPDVGDSQSGITDISLSGRYLFEQISSDQTKISAGAYITLPIGKKELGFQNKFNFGFYGAVRHALDKIIITGSLGFDFFERTTYEWDPNSFELVEKTSYETSVFLSGGAIFVINKQLGVVAEFQYMSEAEYFMLSGGVDYKLGMGRLRGGLGLGLDSDGTPKFSLMAGYNIFLN